MGEINVTPFVDVMLVLLIVFMVTAPLLTVGVEVDLPKTEAGQINADAAPLIVSIQADGALYLQEAKVPFDGLIPRLKAISNANPDVRIFVRGDSSVAYGEVLGVMGLIQAAGFTKVALVAQLPEVR
jgi:biopolymer transport protein TolR